MLNYFFYLRVLPLLRFPLSHPLQSPLNHRRSLAKVSCFTWKEKELWESSCGTSSTKCRSLERSDYYEISPLSKIHQDLINPQISMSFSGSKWYLSLLWLVVAITLGVVELHSIEKQTRENDHWYFIQWFFYISIAHSISFLRPPLLSSPPPPPLPPLPPFPAYGGLEVVVGFKPPTLFCAFYFKLIHWLHFLQIIKEGKDQDDLNELAKLFDIHKAG